MELKLPIKSVSCNKLSPTELEFRKWGVVMHVKGQGLLIGYDELEDIYSQYQDLKKQGIV